MTRTAPRACVFNDIVSTPFMFVQILRIRHQKLTPPPGENYFHMYIISFVLSVFKSILKSLQMVKWLKASVGLTKST